MSQTPETGPLAALLRTHLPPPCRAELDGVEGLESLLREYVAAGQAAWPKVSLEVESFLRHLARHLPAENTWGVLRLLHAGDLYLACACAAGDAAALDSFEQRILSEVSTRLGAVPRSTLDEALQVLREQLLLSRGDGPPKIATYSGRGPLLAWVIISAARMASEVAIREGRQEFFDKPPESFVQLLAPGDPELDLLRKDSRRIVVDVLRKVLAALPKGERTLLRLHHLNGYSMSQLATMYGESRSGVARRVAQARERLLKLTRTELASQLKLDDTELESFLGLVRSRLDLSLSRLMG